MIERLFQRILWAILILWGTTIITFLIAHAVPADPARVYAGANADAETIDRIRIEMRLDDPLIIQYTRYLSKLVQGELGTSLVTNERVLDAVLIRLPTTATLCITAVIFWLLLSIPLGVLTSIYKGHLVDRTILFLSMIAISIPVFWLARMLQYYLAYQAGFFPVAGYVNFSHIILPAITIAIVTTGYYARLVHTNMVEVLNQEFVRVARAKGLSEWRVLFKHTLRNAIIPVITILGLDIAALLGGVVFTENVFALPGLGTLALQSVFNLDVPMIMGVVLFSATLVVSSNIIIDFIYQWIDPRIESE